MIQIQLGQAATLRGLEILNNLGCDIRILQMEGAKDPDEYVIKFGSGGFNLLIEKAISFIGLDTEVDESILEKLRQIDGVLKASKFN